MLNRTTKKIRAIRAHVRKVRNPAEMTVFSLTSNFKRSIFFLYIVENNVKHKEVFCVNIQKDNKKGT
jgi:hypothetical protein